MPSSARSPAAKWKPLGRPTADRVARRERLHSHRRAESNVGKALSARMLPAQARRALELQARRRHIAAAKFETMRDWAGAG